MEFAPFSSAIFLAEIHSFSCCFAFRYICPSLQDHAITS
jgi:hypothetical protein